MKFIDRLLQNRILIHCLFWLSTTIFFGVYGSVMGIPFLAGIIIKFFFLPVQILATYYLIYYQVPTFLYPKKYLRFAISFFLSVLVFCTLAHLVEDFGLAKVAVGYTNVIHTFGEIVRNPFANVGYSAEEVYPTVFIVAGLKFIKQRLEEKTQLDVLEQEKANAEIKLLKAQINPRILSKTLYQLHQLTLDKSEEAPEVVVKLSEMLDYMLYQCNDPNVLVSNEIPLIQNYLDLEKLRHQPNLSIRFYHEFANSTASVTPLLLLTLVESLINKIPTNLANDANFELFLVEETNRLKCTILSNVIPANTPLDEHVKKQLDLLYPNQYNLSTTQTNEVYKLNLYLNLI